jgi:quercetin dioxygenase-like cupin family protein
MRIALLSATALLLPLTSLGAQDTTTRAKAQAQDTARRARARPAAAPRAIVVMADSVQWGPAPPILPAGASLSVLEGDPSRPGVFTMRLRMPDGYRIPPHYHPVWEHVTVVSGTFKVGMGDTFDEGQMKTLSAGSFGAIPPRMRHYAMAQGETEIQLHGTGPWRLVYVNKADDPRTKPKADGR